MKYSALILSFLVVLLFHFQASDAVISCSAVIQDLRPCVSYLVSGSGKPPVACCDGVSALASAASTSADRQAACDCIKSTAGNININNQLAQALPKNCGINFPINISPDVDCSTIG